MQQFTVDYGVCFEVQDRHEGLSCRTDTVIVRNGEAPIARNNDSPPMSRHGDSAVIRVADNHPIRRRSDSEPILKVS